MLSSCDDFAAVVQTVERQGDVAVVDSRGVAFVYFSEQKGQDVVYAGTERNR